MVDGNYLRINKITGPRKPLADVHYADRLEVDFLSLPLEIPDSRNRLFLWILIFFGRAVKSGVNDQEVIWLGAVASVVSEVDAADLKDRRVVTKGSG